MQKLAVIGLDTLKDKVIKELRREGVVELIDQSVKLKDELWAENTKKYGEDGKETFYDNWFSKGNQALEILEKYSRKKQPLFESKLKVNRSLIEELLLDGESFRDKISKLLDLNEQVLGLKDRINKIQQDKLYLKPWESYKNDLQVRSTNTTDWLLGTLPVETDFEKLKRNLEKELGLVELRQISLDKEMRYIGMVFTRDIGDKVLIVLKEAGFSENLFPNFIGSPEENLLNLQREEGEAEEKLGLLIKEIETFKQYEKDIKIYIDIMSIGFAEERGKDKLLKTDRTFFLEGWLPERCRHIVEKVLRENNCYFAFSEPEESDTVPVIIEQNPAFTPFEMITEMYSLPDYRGFDPTSIFAVFYAMFFGIMLSDAGYGLIMMIATFIVLRKYDLEGSAEKMMKLFFYCGLSTTFWGALFGGWFGDIFQVVAKNFFHSDLALEPIWFNPINDPMKLLIFSLAVGTLHIFIGMGIKAYMEIRQGKWFDAICDVGFWYLLIIGLIGWIAGGNVLPVVQEPCKWMTIVGTLGILFTGGRSSKGILGKLVGGLGALYNITGYLSDILSYSRLLALGLATGVIAQVVNTMGGLFGGGIIGGILLLIVFLFGHTLNFAINALGSYVHSCRLQYIEFFGKFYEDGGDAFEPLRENTKYIKIIDNE